MTQLNANPEQVGLVSSIGFLAAALSMIPGTILTNKYDNRTLLSVGWAMSIPVPIFCYFSNTWSDVILGTIIFQLSAFNLPSMNAFIGQLGDPQAAPLIVVPKVFLLGGARAPSYVGYSLLRNMRLGKSRAGQWGFYLTLEQLGFVASAFIGGVIYAGNHASVLIVTGILFVALAALSGFGHQKNSAIRQCRPLNIALALCQNCEGPAHGRTIGSNACVG